MFYAKKLNALYKEIKYRVQRNWMPYAKKLNTLREEI